MNTGADLGQDRVGIVIHHEWLLACVESLVTVQVTRTAFSYSYSFITFSQVQKVNRGVCPRPL